MGSSSSRPRPQQQPHQTQPNYPPNAGFPSGGQQQAPAYAPPAFNGYSNGQFYGGFAPYGVAPPAGFTQPPHVLGHYGQPPPGGPPVQTHEYHQTATIRNQVNLKKHSLALVPQPGNPEELAITFSLDATAPCRVTTFLLATEDPKSSCSLATLNHGGPRPPVHYPNAGMDLKFPGGAGVTGHVINTASHTVHDLVTSYTDSFPLIIRLEALTDEGKREGRRLEELPPGAPLPLWVQAQTTYAKLARDDDGAWRAVVVKQKIWVQGVSYELQEIYGMEGGAAPGRPVQGKAASVVTGSALGELPEGRECVICLSAERDTTVLPCRHMCMCQDCASALKTQTNKCPVCRTDIESLLHIKIQRRQAGGEAGGSGGEAGSAVPGQPPVAVYA